MSVGFESRVEGLMKMIVFQRRRGVGALSHSRLHPEGNLIIKNEILLVLRIKNPCFDIFCRLWRVLGVFLGKIDLKKGLFFSLHLG